MPLWKKSLGLATTDGDDDEDGDHDGHDGGGETGVESRYPRSPTASSGEHSEGDSPRSTSSSSVTSSGVESSGDGIVDTETSVWSAGLMRRRRRTARRERRVGRAVAHEEALATRARLEVRIVSRRDDVCCGAKRSGGRAGGALRFVS